jgi:GntR family transcriptional regulator
MSIFPVEASVNGAGIPLHRQLFLVLRDRIYRGIYAPGGTIPNEAQLCELFSVSRITVRRALADLEAKGLVLRRQRLGTCVNPDFQSARPSGTLEFLDALQDTALDALPAKTLVVRKEIPPADIAGLLKMSEGEKAWHTVRLRGEGETPLVLSEAWSPVRILETVTEAAVRKHLIYRLLLAQGVIFNRVVQEISAESADPQTARSLHTEVGAPLLRMTRLLHDTEDQPVQHLTARVNPERTRMLMDLSATSIGSIRAGALAHDLAR